MIATDPFRDPPNLQGWRVNGIVLNLRYGQKPWWLANDARGS